MSRVSRGTFTQGVLELEHTLMDRVRGGSDHLGVTGRPQRHDRTRHVPPHPSRQAHLVQTVSDPAAIEGGLRGDHRSAPVEGRCVGVIGNLFGDEAT